MENTNEQELKEFLREIKSESKKLAEQKKYQILMQESISHIFEVMQNTATKEQLKEYENIKIRVSEGLEQIQTTIQNILEAENLIYGIEQELNNLIEQNLEDNISSKIDILNIQLNEYMEKKEEIEKSISNTKLQFLLKELNYISDNIHITKDSQIQSTEIEINLDEVTNNTNYGAETEDTTVLTEETIEEKPKIEITTEQKQEETNVLIISERRKKVFLPYTMSDIEYFLRKRKYRTKEEVVKNEFIVPLSKYANFTIARMREGFKLMREREHKGFGQSLKYGLSLILERKLHPAIISACRTVDDLDIYLACLDDNVMSLFDSFQIQFEYAPLKVKQDKTREFFEGVNG